MPAISLVTVVVPDYDAAIAHYCGDLGFDLLEDTELAPGRRWVRVRPPGGDPDGPGATFLLAQADGADQETAIGNQTGGRVSFFLSTDDFAREHARFAAAGVEFLEQPRSEPYGTVAVFRDAFGNRWDLIQPAG